MSPAVLLKSLLPGLLPLLVYVAADAALGNAALLAALGLDAAGGRVLSLALGLAVGVAEFIYTLARDRKADPFVAADTALLAVAGALSIGLKDEIFFKLKPAIVELVFGLAMGLLLVLPPAALKGYMGRTLRGVELPEAALPAMRRSLGLMLAVLALHAGLTVWAAIALTTGAWAFVSGGLLYILFGAAALWQLAAARLKARRAARASGGEEILPLVDEEGRVLGAAPRSACHRGPGMLHPAVRLHVLDGEGRIYLRRRAADLQVLAGRWDAPAWGHVAAGEDAAAALSRRLRDELGVTAPMLAAAGAEPRPALRLRWDTELESELVLVFAMLYPGPFATDGEGIEQGRFWRMDEVRAGLGTGLFTLLFEREFTLLSRSAGVGDGNGKP